MKPISMRLGYELEIGVAAAAVSSESDVGDEELAPFAVGSDGSIHTRKPESTPVELRSKVYDVTQPAGIRKLLDDYKRASSVFVESNDSMGLHFHVSFANDINYIRLCSTQFYEQFIEAYKKRFTLSVEQKRLKNGHCYAYDPSDFRRVVKLQLRGNNRTHAINYASFRRHRTIECRLFPSTMNFRRFRKYVYFFVGFVRSYLQQTPLPTFYRYGIRAGAVEINANILESADVRDVTVADTAEIKEVEVTL